MKKSLFCPKWIFDICVGVTAYEYIVKDIPIDLSAKKFVRGINLRYKEVQLIEIKFAAESIIRFMGEINNPQYKPHERLRYFLFHTLKYETYYSKRKFKTLFGSAFDGTKEKKYSEIYKEGNVKIIQKIICGELVGFRFYYSIKKSVCGGQTSSIFCLSTGRLWASIKLKKLARRRRIF